ncbi:ABC transporter ATP-binding protein [Trueperella bialowiezensis]|uniref:Fluoroquinolones export ATP-binding protein Rv2688c/MT2762 n=1 Tax=Trueperella bialowiezensis TaxID=312285 RepID=A0A448PD59_9ACTO|nr:ABC transporter ATP-binding protein [Trueperella bialowiezensis]VEI12859.1 Fluoroquinolones export ATP-binding protein Rv2688c/MT2762 [Trueperella bialowiezensis]
MVVALENISFSYGNHEVITDLSMSIDPGEIVVLLGPNGAGKTTLIELIVGFLRPARGSVRVLNHDPRAGGTDFWKKIGLVQQQWRDHPKWTARQQLEWIASAHRTTGDPVASAHDALEKVGLADFADHQLGKLSGGQRRRVDFAAATLTHPQFLILDEPTTGLDPVARNDVHELIDSVQLSGATVLMTTHDLAEAEKIGSRILILKDGAIIANGSAEELRAGLDTRSEIRWRDDAGERHVHVTDQPLAFVRTLPDSTADLTISRHTLEDSYLALIGDRS